ncbi:sentrin-specific protease 1-like [Venturia canescens]|uniref:sentrin-specific protease 1-like n=1 Tax=Venturia canescens TaxID=32260 RepID=UPI001C9CD7B8|nr:sentrin-specific protease 1-like [Venturia canescens]
MDVSTQTVDMAEKKHFTMQTGESGFWEKFDESPPMREVEKFKLKVETVKGSKRPKQSTKTQTPQPKDKATQVFIWRLMPIDVDRRSNRQAVEQFIQKFTKYERIGEEFAVPDILSPIRDAPEEENFKMPVSTEEWSRNKREAEKKERERYREEIAKNGKEWTGWKIGEFHWEDKNEENKGSRENDKENQEKDKIEQKPQEYEERNETQKQTRKRKRTGKDAIERERRENIETKRKEKKGVTIKSCDLATLDGNNWLNDEVINEYLNLIVRGSPETFAFTTFFFSKLLSGGFSSVQRWTKKTNIFQFKLILVPMHMGAHWCLTIVDFVTKQIKYFDSLLGDKVEYVTIIFNYLIKEAEVKQQKSFLPQEWTVIIRKNIPRQSNNFDCGVFVCSFAEYEAAGREIDFCQKDMAAIRQKIKRSLIQGKLE